MVVEASDDLTLISAAFFRATELIDGGDTAVVRLTGADGKEVAVIMPLPVAKEMARSVDMASQTIAPKSEGQAKG